MALAQVVYQISTDADFASRMRSDPERALEERGWSLSREEISFLLSALTNRSERAEFRELIKPRWWFGWR
jgi:hypothetical protein